MDNYILDNEEKIYPIIRIEYENKNYLFYSFKDKDLSEGDIYVGEETEDSLLPVSEELLPTIINKFEETVNNIQPLD